MIYGGDATGTGRITMALELLNRELIPEANQAPALIPASSDVFGRIGTLETRLPRRCVTASSWRRCRRR
jgi:hypothetical protein